MKTQVKSKLLMKRSCMLLLMTFASIVSYATAVTGTKTIGTDYLTLAACISDLNTNGISGNVIINVPAGWTETAPTGGYILGSSALNASTSSSSTLTFQKNGSGANPLLTSFVGTSLSADGIFIIQGTDYVTINSIDLQESSSNTTQTTQMEWGYALVKLQSVSPFDGCQYVTIQNSIVTLNQANMLSTAIYSGTHIATDTTRMSIGATGDATNNCSFLGNTLTNVNKGVSMTGFAAASPYTLYDQNNNIGGNGAGQGNSINNFGGSSASGYGVYLAAQNNAKVLSNTIISASTPGAGSIYGIYHGVGNNSNFTVSNNTFQLTLGATGSMYGICNGSGTASNSGVNGLSASLVVSGNTFQNYSFTAANSSNHYFCLYNASGSSTNNWDLGSMKVTGNTVQYFSLNASNIHYLFFTNYCNSNDIRFNNNKIHHIRRTTTTGSTYIWYNYYGAPTGGVDSMVANKVSDVASPTSLYVYYDYLGSGNIRDRVMMYDSLVNDSAGINASSSLYNFYSNYGNSINISYNYNNGIYCPTTSSTYFYNLYTLNANNATATYNTFSNITSYAIYSTYLSSINTNIDAHHNSLSNTTSASGTTYSVYASSGNTASVHDNVFQNFTMTGSGALYGYLVSASSSGNCYNNIVRNGTSTASASFYGMYTGGGNVNFYNDTVYNITYTGGSIYGFSFGGGNANVYNCHFGKLSNISTTGGNVYGTYSSSGTTLSIYNCLIDSLTNAYTSGGVYGIYESAPTIFNCYKNKISYLSGTGTAALVWGIYANSGAINIHNNLIGDLQAPNATATAGTSLVGIYLGSSTVAGGYKVSYNTVVLNSPAASSSAMYWSQSGGGFPLVMKNNVFINNSNPAGTGIVAAMRWNSTTLTNYVGLGSNNNLYYAGTPGAYRLIFYNGTSSYQTLASLKAVVTPADGYSMTENTTFQNLGGIGTDFLRPGASAPTQIESNGINISGITDDKYGTTRQGNTGYTGSGVAPDLGAIEDNYTPNDVNPPLIVMSPLAMSCGTGDRTFTATISDVTGVATGTLAPTVWFKKGVGGTWTSNPGTLLTGTITSGTWSFTIPAVAAGSPVLGDVIYYFVVAQDVITTPNVGSNVSGTVATSVTTITTYPTAPPSYTVANALSGTYTVGSTGTYTSIGTAAAAYNGSCLTGAVTFQLVSSTYPGETFPIQFNANPYASSINMLTIKPAPGVQPTVNGASASSAIIKLNGADYITIDGSNTVGGVTKDLTLNNTSATAGACVWNAALGGPGNGADYNTVKNTSMIGGTNTVAYSMGVFSGSTAAGISTSGDDNKNFTVQNCNIQNTFYAINIFGTATYPHTNTLIQGDSIGSNNPSLYCLNYGMSLSNILNTTVQQNTIFNMKTASTYIVDGIYIGANCNTLNILRNNVIGLWNTSGGSYGSYGFDVASTGSANITIANNFITDLVSGGAGLSTANNPFGIRLAQTVPNLKIYDNTIRLTSNVPNTGAAMYSACIMMSNNQPGIDLKGNILVNTMTTSSLGGSQAYGFWIYSSGLTLGSLDYNDYAGSSSSNVTFNTASVSTTTPFPTLAGWAGYTGGDAHSISVMPTFVSSTDNHLLASVANAPLLANTMLPSVLIDYDSTVRVVPPTIGAHEVHIPPTVLASPTLLTFPAQTVTTYSPGQTFTITGTFLNPAGTLTVTAVSGIDFQVSPDSATWSASYTIPYTGTTKTSIVYVRFHPTTATPYTGTVSITGGGLSTATVVNLNGTGAALCSSTPVAGTATITPGIGGVATGFSLSLTGTTVIGGLLYQWQSSSTGTAGSFTNISGATNNNYNFTGISANTFYQAVVTCPSYTPATSNTVAATYSMAATFTGTIGTYVVPAGITSLRIITKGAQGGNMTNTYPSQGGQGAIMQGDFCVTPGQVLKYIVGEHPADGGYSSGGGGGSFVWDNATGAPLIIAGGGGGAGYWYPLPRGVGGNASTGPNGMQANGGYNAGGNGIAGSGATIPASFPGTAYYGAGGAGWLSGGNGGYFNTCTSHSSGGSTPLAGGAGGALGGTVGIPGGFGGGGGSEGCNNGPSGGGGGYSGGAGAIYTPSSYWTGGGGGGSLNTGYNQVNSVGNTGHGTIIFATPVTANAVATTSAIAFPVTTTGTSSASQSFSVTATGLAPGGTLTLTPTAGFDVSFDGTTWCGSSSPCTFSYSSGCTTIPMYVRSSPAAVGAYTGTATLSGGNLGTPIVVTLNGSGANICSGTPTAGTSVSTLPGATSGMTYTLSNTGTTVAGGLNYQWQSSTDSVTWTNIPGATNFTLTTSGLSVTTFYQSIVTCSASSASATSVPVKVIYLSTPACVPSAASWYYEGATYVAYGANAFNVTGYSGSTLSDIGIFGSSSLSTGYLDRTGMTPVNMQPGGVYAASMTKGTLASTQECQVWIDFNDDGTYSVSEEVTPVSGWTSSSGTNPVNFNITIPYGVPGGMHLMRLRANYEGGGTTTVPPHIDPCLRWYGGVSPQYYGGTITDYYVNIVPLPMCTGTPTAGTVAASPSVGCAPVVTSLSVSGASIAASGYSYQWQSSPDNSTWTSITGATQAAYTPSATSTIYYTRRITCAGSGLFSYPSTGVQVTVNPVPSISGISTFCQGIVTTLSTSIPGGTWTSSTTAVATIGASSGIITTGSTPGTTTITYTLSTGCKSTMVDTILQSPSALVFSPSASSVVCLGGSSAFSVTSSAAPVSIVEQNFNTGMTGAIGGTWSIVNTLWSN